MSISSNESDIENENLKGIILDKKYVLIHNIGHGSFSTVWLSLNTKNKKYYAVKVQNCDDFEAGEEEIKVMQNFKNEKCPYINLLIEEFDYETEFGTHICMVFELMAGTLHDVLEITKYNKGLSLNITKTIIRQLAEAMEILNTKYNLLHSDIKPENILVVGSNNMFEQIIKLTNSNKLLSNELKKKKPNRDNIREFVRGINFDNIIQIYDCENPPELINSNYIDNIKVKLSDFGTCKNINYSGYSIQTRYYRAPEIILGYKYNKNCDMWSFGCLIYELLTGELLFDPDKYERLGVNKNHLCEMICTLGKIPDVLLDNSERKFDFYSKSGLIKGIDGLKYNSLHKRVQEALPNYLDQELFLTLDLLYKLLNYDPFMRLNCRQLIGHGWMKR